jgi:protocatechuate 3,4-dioxygenase beta subunit
VRRNLFLVSILAASIAVAQPTGVPNSSVSGTVKDAGTGKPLANYNVSTYVGATWINDTIIMGRAKQVNSVTDEQGRYKLSDLPPGPYRIEARSAEDFSSSRTKRITLSGQDLNDLDFNVIVSGKISGKVLDENKEPVPDIAIYLVSKEYFMGVAGYFFKGYAKTDDRGQYTLARVSAGQPYFLMAQKDERKLPPRSQAPLDPRLRRRVPMRTFYPNSPAKEGAEALVLRPAEHREHVNIELKKTQNYCIEGTLMGALGPAALNFSIEALQPSSGVSSGGGMFVVVPNGVTGPDGKFRICDLSPGTYRLIGMDSDPGGPQMPSNFAIGNIVVSDRDLQNVRIPLTPGLPLDGEVVWDGTPPEQPVTTKVLVSLQPLSRNPMSGERTSARPDIPGTFSFPSLVMADYGVRTLVNAPSLYVKDVTYAGHSVLNEPLRLGSSVSGAGMRVIMGRDGATLSARVTDKDGNNVPAIAVLVMPADVSSEAILQRFLVTGETDQSGQYTSHTLPPGKYYVAAISEPFNASTESIDRLWRARLQFKEVELAPSGSAQVSLVPQKIE